MMIIFLAAFASVSAFLVLWMLNFVMARYDQLDALPIYQSLNLVMGIICGLIILGEVERYKTANLIGIFLACIIVISGIILLGFKKTAIATKEKTYDDQAGDLSFDECTTEDSSARQEKMHLLDKNSFRLLKMLT